MFKRLKEGLTSAADAVLNNGNNEKINSLVALGFGADDARNALTSTNGDVDRAAELLFMQRGSTNPTTAMPTTAAAATTASQQQQQYSEDTSLERAMQESLQEEELRLIRQAQMESTNPTPAQIRSAASVRAGQAALERFENNKYNGNTSTKKKNSTVASLAAAGTSNNNNEISLKNKDILQKHHPNVKVPTKLKDKTKEEQILRLSNRLKVYPKAIDTLYKSLVALRDNPTNAKYRTINKNTMGYQRSLGNVPNVEEFLSTMNFKKSNNSQTGDDILLLQEYDVDPALLYLGISALEQMKLTTEYQNEKIKLKFNNEINQFYIHNTSNNGNGNDDNDLIIECSNFMSKLPSQPKENSTGSLIQVQLGPDINIRRRFDGDDTLEDVLNYIGAHGPKIYNKLVEEEEWDLINANDTSHIFHCNQDKYKTLQYLDCWPSGRLEIVPKNLK